MTLPRLQVRSCFCLFLLCSQLASGQDARDVQRVTVGPAIPKSVEAEWTSQSKKRYIGSVRQLDANNLIMVVGDKGLTISSDRVEKVEILWNSPTLKEAMRLFDQREYEKAVTALSAAQRDSAKLKIPAWKQRILIAAIVRCADAMGNPRTAGIIFADLAKSSPPPALLYADLPLCWTSREIPSTLRDQSLKWLESDVEVEQLLGASWQLLGPKASDATQVLKQLRQSENKTIAKLAIAQGWRLEPPPRTLGTLQAWLDFRDTLIPPLQLGPTEFLADRLMRVGETDLAIGQLVRIASEHSDRYHRAVLALESAKMLLTRDGKAEQAQRLDPWIQKIAQP